MPRFHVRPARAVAEIMYAVRAQVLNQPACLGHVRSIRLSIPANYSADSPWNYSLKFANVHPNYYISSPRGNFGYGERG